MYLRNPRSQPWKVEQGSSANTQGETAQRILTVGHIYRILKSNPSSTALSPSLALYVAQLSYPPHNPHGAGV
jgi:hypothetical protein